MERPGKSGPEHHETKQSSDFFMKGILPENLQPLYVIYVKPNRGFRTMKELTLLEGYFLPTIPYFKFLFKALKK
jgi:hypothetical protein